MKNKYLVIQEAINSINRVNVCGFENMNNLISALYKLKELAEILDEEDKSRLEEDKKKVESEKKEGEKK